MPELYYDKIDELADSHGMKLKASYALDGYIKFIEVVTNKYQEPFLIYVPSKYDIKHGDSIPIEALWEDDDYKQDIEPVSDVKNAVKEESKEEDDEKKEDEKKEDEKKDDDDGYVFIGEKEESKKDEKPTLVIVDETGPSNLESAESLEKKDSENLESHEKKELKEEVKKEETKKFEESLPESTKPRDIGLSDGLSEVKEHLEKNARYLKKFKGAIKKIPYSLCIVTLEGITNLHEDGEIDNYAFIRKRRVFDGSDNISQLFVITTIETFFNRVDTVEDEVRQILVEIQKISLENKTKQIEYAMLNLKNYGSRYSQALTELESRKKKYREELNKLFVLLHDVDNQIVTYKKRAEDIPKSTYGMATVKGTYQDMDNSLHLQDVNSKLHSAQVMRDRVAERIRYLKLMLNNLMLETDKLITDQAYIVKELMQNLGDIQGIKKKYD